MKPQPCYELSCRLLAGVVLLSTSLSLYSSDKDHRELESHVHGEGTVDVAVEADELVIEIRMPATNVVGFEHEPSTEEQRHTVQEALGVFKDARNVVLPTEAAGCQPESVHVELHGLSEHEEDDRTDEHAHEDEAEHEDGEEHSELVGTYQFHCKHPEDLRTLTVQALDHLHNVEEILVRLVTPTRQTATHLRPEGDRTVLITE